MMRLWKKKKNQDSRKPLQDEDSKRPLEDPGSKRLITFHMNLLTGNKNPDPAISDEILSQLSSDSVSKLLDSTTEALKELSVSEKSFRFNQFLSHNQKSAQTLGTEMFFVFDFLNLI